MKKKRPIENNIYASIIGYCEGRERKPVGNGHHMAQDLTTLVAIGLLPKQQRKVFDCLTKTESNCKEISLQCGISSKQVSSILIQIYSRTLLVHFKRKGRIKLWYK